MEIVASAESASHLAVHVVLLIMTNDAVDARLQRLLDAYRTPGALPQARD